MLDVTVNVFGKAVLRAGSVKVKCSVCEEKIPEHTKHIFIQDRSICVRCIGLIAEGAKRDLPIDNLKERYIITKAMRETTMEFRKDIVRELRKLGYRHKDIVLDTVRKGAKSKVSKRIIGLHAGRIISSHKPKIGAFLDEFTCDTEVFVTNSLYSLSHCYSEIAVDDLAKTMATHHKHCRPRRISGGDPEAAKTIAKAMHSMNLSMQAYHLKNKAEDLNGIQRFFLLTNSDLLNGGIYE